MCPNRRVPSSLKRYQIWGAQLLKCQYLTELQLLVVTTASIEHDILMKERGSGVCAWNSTGEKIDF